MFAAPLLLAALAAPGDLPGDGAANWPRFRGPDGAGVAADARFPDAFTAADLAWSTPLPGAGVSSPVVWDGAVFVTAADGGRRLVLKLDAATGGIAWEREVRVNPAGPAAPRRLHAKNAAAASTPAVDGTRVFVAFADAERLVVAALSHAGDDLWRREVGRFVGNHGAGASPVRVDAGGRELLVLTNDQGQDDPRGFVIALDAATGETAWQTARASRRAAYATPAVWDSPTGPVLLTASGAAGVAALDAATGAELWNSGELPARVVASPVLAGGLVWALCGSGGAGKLLVGVDPATGDVRVERTRSLPYVPTPVAAGDLLFLWGDRGVVSGLDAATGDELWAERVGGNFSASPIVVGDAVLNVTEDGTVVVLDAARRYRLRGRSDLGEATNATPAVAGGRAFFRLTDRLLCLPLTAADD